MSYNTFASNLLFRVKSQYDIESSNHNQCSWFVYEMVKLLKENNWVVPEGDNFQNIYNRALESATEKRNIDGVLPWGESIFSRRLYEAYTPSIETPKCTPIGGYSNLRMLVTPEMEHITAYKEKLRTLSIFDLRKRLSELYVSRSYYMINRFGQSFLIFPKDQHTYYIFDSHVRDFGTFTLDNVLKYITFDNSESMFIISVCGHQTNGKMCDTSTLYNDIDINNPIAFGQPNEVDTML